MIRSILKAFFYLSLALLMPFAVHADATLTMQDVSGKMDSVVEVKGHMVRISSPGDSDYMLYDAQRDMVIHVNSASREYMEIDRNTLAGMADSMASVKKEMAMMRERLKNLPPEQRAMVEQQMGGMANLGAMEDKPTARLTSVRRGSDKIAGFKCERYDVMSGKQRVSELCVATRTGAGMSKSDFSTVTAAIKFMREMAAEAQKMSAGLGVGVGAAEMSMGDVDGVPVSVKDLRSGREFRLVKVSGDKLDETRFNEYRSMRKKDMPKMR